MWTGQMEMHQVSSQQMQLNHVVWTDFLCDYITWYMYLSTFYYMYLCLSNWKITLYFNLNNFLLVMSHSCSWVNPYCNGTYYRTASCGTQTVDSMTSIIKTTIWNTLVSLKLFEVQYSYYMYFQCFDTVGCQEEHATCKNWVMRCWLSVWSEVQIVCIWSSWCHSHPKTPSSLAWFKFRLVLPFLYRFTQVVLEKRSLNGCSSCTCTCSLSTCTYTVRSTSTCTWRSSTCTYTCMISMQHLC